METKKQGLAKDGDDSKYSTTENHQSTKEDRERGKEQMIYKIIRKH
jgi:competence protein ComGF